MKKQYISPNLTVVFIHQQFALLEGSVTGTLSSETTNSAYSRRGGSFWDDDDEEDD